MGSGGNNLVAMNIITTLFTVLYNYNKKTSEVIAFIIHLWHSHADYHNGTTLLAPEDLLTDLLKPYDMGAQGVIMWGTGSELNNNAFIKVGYCYEAFITVCNMHERFLAAQSYQLKLLLKDTLK